MIAVALWVASLPGAVGRMPAFGAGPLLLGTAGLLVICLLHTPLRWSGARWWSWRCVWAVRTPLPDVLVAADGRRLAVRGADGRLAVHRTGRDAFAVREWLAADADAPAAATTRPWAKGFACDPIGCIAKLADGALVSHAVRARRFRGGLPPRRVVVVDARSAADCDAL